MTEEKFRLEAVVEQSGSRKRNKANNFANACPVMDHECRHFRSVKEMCRYWGVEDATYYYRRKQGFSKEEALTMAKRKPGGRKKND